MPLIKEWIKKAFEDSNNVPPPIESIALGALAMTPGVIIKDILNKGLSIRLFNEENKNTSGIPFFVKVKRGQLKTH